jgi:pantoate--beta-alanine ligase
MKIINTIEAFRTLNIKASLGFVPTMGALHSAHLTLIERSVEENERTVVSIFVNPTQFNDLRDLDVYPKPLEDDIRKCENAGADYVFIPKIKTMYFDNEVLVEAPKGIGDILEGACRPGHFNGVLRVVLKLLNIVKPDKLYLGQKDAQQLAIITKMVKDFFIDVDVVPCELIREDNGLAMSSRNTLLSSDERQKALLLSKALFSAKNLVDDGERNLETIKKNMTNILSGTSKIEYVEILARDFSAIEKLEIDNAIILVAAMVGKTRLIDNILL